MCFLSKEERAKRTAAKLRAKQEKLAKKKGLKVEEAKKAEPKKEAKREPIRVQEGNQVNRPEQKPVVQKVEPKEPKKETTVTKAEPKKEAPKKEASKDEPKKEAPKAEEKAAPQERAKSTKKIYHISYRKEDNQWQVKLGGAKVLKLFKTQEEGIQYAKQLAGNQEGSIVIHMKDGTIRKQKY